MANRNRVQLILGRRFSAGIHEEIKWRLAKADDFGDVVKSQNQRAFEAATTSFQLYFTNGFKGKM